MKPSILALLCLGFALPAQAAVFAGFTGTNLVNQTTDFTSSFTGSFTGTTNSAYNGTFDGTYNYTYGTTPTGRTGGVSYNASSLQPRFSSGPGNSSASFDHYATITFDFSGLAGGVLPAGTSFFFEDWDGADSDITNWTAANGGAIGTAWLSLVSQKDTISSIDFGDGAGLDQSGNPNPGTDPGPADFASLSGSLVGSSFTYTLDSKAPTARPTVEFATTQDITTMSMQLTLNSGFQNFIQIADSQVIPEPSTTVFLAGTMLALLGRRRRRA